MSKKLGKGMGSFKIKKQVKNENLIRFSYYYNTFQKYCIMKKLLSLLIFFFFFSSVSTAQDIIKLNSGLEYKVKIIKEYDDSVIFYYYQDSLKTIHSLKMKYVHDVIINPELVNLPFDDETGKITYKGVVELKGMTAQQLYSNGKAWFSKAFGSGKAVIDFDDNTNYKIIGKGKIPILVKGNLGKQPGGYVNFTISLFFKDGKYKYIFTNFYHEGEDYPNSFNNSMIHCNSAGPLEIEKQTGAFSQNNWFAWKDNWHYLKEQTNEAVLSLILSLKQNMISLDKEDNF